MPIHFEDKRFSDFLRADSERWNKQTEYLLEVQDVIVEPERCFSIINFNELVSQSVVFKEVRQYPYILPYLFRKKRNIKEIEAAVLYDGSSSRRYYHHFVNAVNSLYVFYKQDLLPLDIPFIVNRVAYESPFFRFLHKRSDLFRSINWMVLEKNDWVKVRKLYHMQCIHFDDKPWRWTRELYQLDHVKSFRKVFLNRDKNKFGRFLSNEDEVIKMLTLYGFEIVYAENITVEEQMKLFQETKYLVALHGMGLVQQFFMDYDEAHVIEVMPLNRMMPLYYWQAHALGIKHYDVVVGGNMKDDKDYPVDLATLKRAVERMLNA